MTKSTGPRVLVLLAAFNGARWIGEQIDSILAQVDVDVHVVVSDDGSTDETRAEIDSLAHGGRVTLISSAVPTGAAAQNFFFLIRENAAAGFDLVAFADQDDIWSHDKLRRASEAVMRDGMAGYSSAVTARWDDGRQQTLTQVDRPTNSDFLFEGFGQGCTFVLSQAFYQRLRDFLTAHEELTRDLHYHDWTAYALARTWGLRWVFDPRPSMVYRQHLQNDTGSRSSLAGVAKRASRIADGWYRRQVAAITRLCLAAAPSNPVVMAWHALDAEPATYGRRLRVAWFCLRGGRRRALDTAVLVFAALAGWL